MGAMSSQITIISIVYSTVCSGANQRKYQSSASLAFFAGNSQMASNAENVSIWWRHNIHLIYYRNFYNGIFPSGDETGIFQDKYYDITFPLEMLFHNNIFFTGRNITTTYYGSICGCIYSWTIRILLINFKQYLKLGMNVQPTCLLILWFCGKTELARWGFPILEHLY